MLRQRLIDYSQDICSGKIIACQKHRWACQRFLRDIEQEGTDAFPFLFSDEKADDFLEWMRLFKHHKGVLVGKYIEPAPIQEFIFGNVYGWLHKDTGYRRFKQAYWQVARKNAKSQSLALVATYEAMALGEGDAEVYCAATKADQAKIVWKLANTMLSKCKELKGKYKVAYGEIKHLKTDSIIKALSKEVRKSGDGLNPQCGIIDEYHAHETSEILDIIDSGMISRAQPLLIIITTAGFDLAKPCYLVEYQYVSQILDPNNPIENDQYFVMVNELDRDEEGKLIDDIHDEACWPKSNPIVCSYPEGIASLRAKLKAATDAPEKKRNFLTKNMNIWVDQKENGYMALGKWAVCGTRELPDLAGLECIVGIDLSAKIDLTSVGFEFCLPDGRYVVLSHSFMPEDTLAAKRHTDKVPYDLWVKQGWITTTPGAVVDYRFVAEYIKQRAAEEEWTIKEICFDPYNATQFAQELMSEGYMCIEIRQGVRTLSEPTKSFRELTYSGLIVHDENPVLTWTVGNAVTRQDHNENIMLDKDKSRQRIDPITAMINAHVRAIVAEINKPSVYETRGALVL